MRKFYRKKNRLQWYDYSSNWCYFVTICTKNMNCYFGKVIEGAVVVNDRWKVVEEYWKSIPNIYSWCELHERVIMPNHIHGILLLHNCDASVSRIIKWFKQVSTKKIRRTDKEFWWHRSFHDSIIHDEKAYNNISNYIIANPKHRKKDAFNNPLS